MASHCGGLFCLQSFSVGMALFFAGAGVIGA